jgi:3-hydroxymyristoyl/3-hydroxydecanoyl-(acyl carrier protein) dehydratase
MTARVPLTIAADHPAFAGHFPDGPIVPGVVLLDEALHALADSLGLPLAGCELQSVKFRHVLRPGEPLEMRHEQGVDGASRFSLWSAEQLIAEGSVRLPTPARESGHGR